MGFFTWLKSLFGSGEIPLSGSELVDAYADGYSSVFGEYFFREIAFWSATNLIANAVAKCEFKTYIDGKEVQKQEHYLWNIEPNKNQNANIFIKKLISMLYQNNECLVVEQNGQLLVADSFDHKEYALLDDVFTNVAVGDFTFNRSFYQNEVLYFRLQHCNMRALVNGLYQTYSKLISYSMTAYQRSRGTKGVFKYDTLPASGPQKDAFDSLINEKIGKWLTGDNAALPLGAGQDWKELEHKTYNNESTRDIRAQIDDISDFTAKGFGIHPALMRGDIQDIEAAFMYTMTFGVDPLVDNLQAEINRKRNGYAGMSRGTYLKIDTKQIKHVDLLSMASPIDKLIGSGTFNVNDIRKLLGEDIINEPWAFQHFITKNYVTFNEAMNGTKKGGEE